MALVKAGDINLNYVEFGKGDNIVVFIHGNLGCVNWMDLVWPKLPEDLHIYAFDWRGCGGSDKPEPDSDYSNYTFKQHAIDMLNAIKNLGIKKCNLANHSTGGIIATRMLLMEPDMFGKVFCLDPITPKGAILGPEAIELFKMMKADRNVAFAGLASAAPTLFVAESLQPGNNPEFAEGVTREQKDLFNLLIDKTQLLSDGIWFGTPHNLEKEFNSGELASKMPDIKHEHLILWGEQDLWIPKDDVVEMADKQPNAKLEIIQGVGHSLNVEAPDKFVKIFTDFFC